MSPEPARLRIALCSEGATSLGDALASQHLSVRTLGLPDGVGAAIPCDDVDLVLVETTSAAAAERALRSVPRHLPVVIVTAEGDDHDRARLLHEGADDVVTSRVGARELAARCHARVRASRGTSGLEPRRLDVGALALDLDRRRAFVREVELRLTSFELDLLAELVRRAGAVVQRPRLSLVLTGHDRCTSLNVHVSHVRAKLASARAGIRIRSVRNVGYRLDEAPEGDASASGLAT